MAQLPAEVAHGIHGVARVAVFAGVGQRRKEVRMIGAGQRDHRKAMRERSHLVPGLVRWMSAGHEVHFVEMEAALRGAGYG
jgi:hypothetical protein